MSRTIRGRNRFDLPDGEITNIFKDKKPKKRFLLDASEKPYTKSAGGPGNKRGWKVSIPKWLYKKYKEKDLVE